MDTPVYFTVNGAEECGRVSPKAGAHPGGPLRLVADLNNMHLMDDDSGAML
jgi:multiple sugar transport system ATP-binding protein